jgi:transposase
MLTLKLCTSEIIFMDNLPIHTTVAVEAVITAVGARQVPAAYSPKLSPIQNGWSKIKLDPSETHYNSDIL